MPYTVTQQKRGGFEYTNVAATENAALCLAQMMRRAGDEYSVESSVTVRDGSGMVVAAWHGSSYGWKPMEMRPAEPVLQPLGGRVVGGSRAARTSNSSGRFGRLPTESMQQSNVSHHGSYASISITDYSAVSVA
jgi:hypothetical protein